MHQGLKTMLAAGTSQKTKEWCHQISMEISMLLRLGLNLGFQNVFEKIGCFLFRCKPFQKFRTAIKISDAN